MINQTKIYIALLLFFFGSSLMAEELTGFWRTVDKHTGQTTSVIAVYPYQGKYYGRIIATYNKEGIMDDTMYHPKERAPGIQGTPYYSGLDIVWNVSLEEGRYRGYVVDPRKGKIYDAELWKENGNLILRGEVFIFGKNEIWPPFLEENFTASFKKPDIKTFVPIIPKVRD